MEEKYGKKLGQAKPLLVAVSGILMVACIILVAGIAVLGVGISKGKFNVVSVPLLLVGILMMIHSIRTIRGSVACYENAIVITETYKVTVLPREDIAAVYWERPGASSSNDKMQTNATIADIIMVGGRKHYKISDGYYDNIDILGKYQDIYKIPQEIKR